MGLERTLFIYLHPLPKHTFILMTLLTTYPAKEPNEGHSHGHFSSMAPQLVAPLPRSPQKKISGAPTPSKSQPGRKTISYLCAQEKSPDSG